MEKYEQITSDDKKAKEVYQENDGIFVPWIQVIIPVPQELCLDVIRNKKKSIKLHS